MPPQEAVQRAHLLVRAHALHVVSAPAPLELDELVEVQARAYNKAVAEKLEDVEGALDGAQVPPRRTRETTSRLHQRLTRVGAAAQGRAHSILR